MTAVASAFSDLAKKRKQGAAAAPASLEELEQRIAVLDAQVAERDDRIDQLAQDLSFVSTRVNDQR